MSLSAVVADVVVVEGDGRGVRSAQTSRLADALVRTANVWKNRSRSKK